ncbi:glycosyltransferase family 39 protein [Paraferrimonas sp. SM1919]|uniref:ArnT family glycosyltransferase n=1 Tax=Paraferrimonas sp. SM1919 TaxID=2662263 RepID=UPI0013D0CD6D|nr:glycosyltransferase family 39 protein [Paraferrimonas sp. SM1919]
MKITSTDANSNSFHGVLLFLALLLCGYGQFNHDLWTPDEPRVVAISQAMSETGDYVVPMLSGIPFVEKPPLYFMAAATTISALPFVEPGTAVRALNTILSILTLWFTYLLAKDMAGRRLAVAAVVVLATMEGFMLNMHWSRVDNILLLFLISSFWFIYRIQEKQQSSLVPLAGLSVGALFLSKGPIGIIFLGGLYVPLMVVGYFNGTLRWRLLVDAVLTLVIASAVSGYWMYSLYTHDNGEALWKEWFWDNQVGRMDGTSVELGHIYPGHYHYYLKSIAEYALPWLPVLVAWLVMAVKQVKAKQYNWPMLALFAGLSLCLIVLTISDTKRSLYIQPLLPMLAIIIADMVIRWQDTKWYSAFNYFWGALITVVMALLIFMPLILPLLDLSIPPHVADHLLQWHWQQPVFLVAGIAFVYWCSKQKFNQLEWTAALTFVLYYGLWTVAAPGIDSAKSMRADTIKFVEQIPVAERPTIAAYGFSETTLAALKLYGDWEIMLIEDEQRILDIVRGNDPQYQSIIIDTDTNAEGALAFFDYLAQEELQIVAEGHPRSNKTGEGLYWVKAIENK